METKGEWGTGARGESEDWKRRRDRGRERERERSEDKQRIEREVSEDREGTREGAHTYF